MNQLLLSPQRRSRRKAPQAEIKNRPWSPVRVRCILDLIRRPLLTHTRESVGKHLALTLKYVQGQSPRRQSSGTAAGSSTSGAPGLVQRQRSPNRSGASSPVAAGRKVSPERSSYGKISSSYERLSREAPAARSFNEADHGGDLMSMGAGVTPKAKLSSELLLDQSQQPEIAQPMPNRSWRQLPGHQQSSPCVFGGTKTNLEAMCKYCHLAGSVELVLATGPWHNVTCKRWSKQPPAKKNEHHGRLRDSSPVREGEVLSEEDQKKKDVLHKQMLVLKKQLEEQLHRLQSKGHVDGAAQAGGESSQKGGKAEDYNRP